MSLRSPYEARRPLQQSLAAASAHTPPSPAYGRCCASAGPLSPLRAAAPAGLADAIRVRSNMPASHERVVAAEFVEGSSTRGARSSVMRI